MEEQNSVGVFPEIHNSRRSMRSEFEVSAERARGDEWQSEAFFSTGGKKEKKKRERARFFLRRARERRI